MIIALFIAFITADIAEMLHSRLGGVKFSAGRAVIYLVIINLIYVCYMLFFRREPFSIYVYYYGPKALLRYIAYALGLCASVPLLFTALTGPKRIFLAFRQSAWLSVSFTIVLVLSASAYFTYKKTQAVSLTVAYPAYSEPENPVKP